MAALLASTFFLCAIVGRMLIQFYYTRDHGVRFAHKSAPWIEIVPGTTFVASFAASLVLLALNELELISVAAPVANLQLPATALGILGIGVTVIAQIQMGRSWRIGVDQTENTQLITAGLYAKSRNPIYFGILLYWLSISALFPHPAMWGCAVVCWSSIELIVRKIEEPYLLRVHGDEFAAYCDRTFRYRIL